jgi:hypothetical protein
VLGDIIFVCDNGPDGNSDAACLSDPRVRQNFTTAERVLLTSAMAPCGAPLDSVHTTPRPCVTDLATTGSRFLHL